jgi:glutaredoxin
MDSYKRSLRVYTLPDCPNCSTLKRWLEARSIGFEERIFDTETQLEFIMRNVFGSPPVLEVGEMAAPAEELFIGEKLKEERVREVIRSGEA